MILNVIIFPNFKDLIKINKMVFFNLCTRNFLFLSLLNWLYVTSVGALNATYIYHVCTNPTDTSSTANSIYRSNLNTLLSSLSSKATSHEFHNASFGGVYGLFFCRGDINTNACRDCVNFAAKDVVKRCPTEELAVLWYEECMLRYSNTSFFGKLATWPAVYLWNVANGTDQQNRVLNTIIKEAAAEAPKSDSGIKNYATMDASLNEYGRLYTLAQCTPDLSAEDCSRCLTNATGRLPTCCDRKLGGRVLFPSCNIRYEFYPFYNQKPSSPATSGIPISAPPAQTISPVPSPGFMRSTKGKNKVSSAFVIVASVVSVVATALLVATGRYFCMRARKNHNALIAQENAVNDVTVESLQYNFRSIETATSNFSDYNVLGEGGFGKVYKGKLQDGQEIAVKRLSKSSSQGALEFKNEVLLVAKLQHRNLVRLLGFCLEGDEKMLVYEYVPNKSLDYFLFDAEKNCQMKWSIRRNIIEGIVRGVLYLHEDSRLKIIHRDLKAGNILLDENMNPKVSDFGMAKMFREDEPQGSTKRVVGTYGYMAPEYAMEGFYSIKSDVYSFGVLLLEILSGRRNSSFHATDCVPSLIANAWQLWNEGKVLDLVDQCLRDSRHPNEFLRYIQIGLLCVQEDALLRPTMSSVVLMLKSEAQSLSQPERPAFITTRYTSNQQIVVVNSYSGNEITVSEFFPR